MVSRLTAAVLLVVGCECSHRPAASAGNDATVAPSDAAAYACQEGATRTCGTEVGACAAGIQKCEGGIWNPCAGVVQPTTEVCGNSEDDDCDGSTDEGCCTASDWSIETVDGDDDVGAWPTLAVAADAVVHVSYVDFTNHRVKHAEGVRGGPWSTEAVFYGDYDGWFDVWLALDESGAEHLIWPGNPWLRYARKAVPGADWNVDTVVNAPGNQGVHSLAVDPSGTVHLTYTLGGGAEVDLYYARGGPEVWTSEFVDYVGRANIYPSLALDAIGGVHMSYLTADVGLTYTDRSPEGSWSLESVESPSDAGVRYRGRSLAVDADMVVHDVFSAGSQDLWYTRRSPDGTTTVEEVAAPGGGIWGASLALNAAGGVHTSYHQIVEGEAALVHAYRETDGTWATSVIESGLGFQKWNTYTWLALDADGGAHAGYYDATDGDLRYAHRCP